MDRQPLVAGQFYPGNKKDLLSTVSGYLQGKAMEDRTFLTMVPHAGYIFSGSTAGKTLARANLAEKLILLGPNHTGQGERISVWPDGKWIIPGFDFPVDSSLADSIMGINGFSSDYQAHIHEHSLEVILPFLGVMKGNVPIVPIAVSESRLDVLAEAGKNLAQVIDKLNLDVSLIISSDMSHYISHEQAQTIDALAIEQVLDLNPEGLYKVVMENKISMCGI
ncbi:MAG: AmmeMemoRadiSam system protein B, partial [Desulfovibrionales bacterium]|nr:AmmeMemoRadiSam system protein B [Desulfovibrionales bacterium]